MKRILLLMLLALAPAAGRAQSNHVVWFDQPALYSTASCPMGNGHLGAMLFGGIDYERVVLNETGMWSGSPQNADRAGAVKFLPQIRQLLLEGKNLEADKLADQQFTSTYQGGRIPGKVVPRSAPGAGSINQFGCFQTLGNLWLKFEMPPGSAAAAKDYRRQLDLSNALTDVVFKLGGTSFKREAFVSAPDDAIVLRLTASRPGQISCVAVLDRPEKFQTVADGNNGLLMTGQLNNGVDGKGVRYAARLQAVCQGGSISSQGNTLEIKNADEVIFFVTAMTDIKTFGGPRSDDPARATADEAGKIAAKNYEEIKQAHIADYQKYYNRASLSLGSEDPAAGSKPTPERLQAFSQGAEDPELAALYFNFGRYLLISSSRPGGLPPTLVGLWTDEIQTAWNGDWHLDINLEMNYWPVDVANLSDLIEPYFDFISSLQKPGAKTAETYYGARGWVSHAVGNPWGFTAPGWHAGWGMYASSPWLCQGLWDHYAYTQDQAFLKQAYPVMKGAAQFFADTLVEEPTHKWLVTSPSNSPENPFILPNGDRTGVCMGPTMDEQQIRELFGACIEASKILGVDQDFRDELVGKRARLAPTRISSDGRIMEWLQEYKEGDPHHREVANLWGLYPGVEITPATMPELAAAAAKSLIARGNGGCGFTLAYKIALWARLGDQERAYQFVKALLRPLGPEVFSTIAGGGTYPNLFDAAPPWMIEGNLGATAAIAEMLLQCNEGDIHLLPAVPAAWADGSVKGFRVRGAMMVDFDWKDKKLVSAVIYGPGGSSCKVRYGEKSVTLQIPANGELHLDGNLKSS